MFPSASLSTKIRSSGFATSTTAGECVVAITIPCACTEQFSLLDILVIEDFLKNKRLDVHTIIIPLCSNISLYNTIATKKIYEALKSLWNNEDACITLEEPVIITDDVYFSTITIAGKILETLKSVDGAKSIIIPLSIRGLSGGAQVASLVKASKLIEKKNGIRTHIV